MSHDPATGIKPTSAALADELVVLREGSEPLRSRPHKTSVS
jgi:hypothetical protein